MSQNLYRRTYNWEMVSSNNFEHSNFIEVYAYVPFKKLIQLSEKKEKSKKQFIATKLLLNLG